MKNKHFDYILSKVNDKEELRRKEFLEFKDSYLADETRLTNVPFR